ncbi:hypothetical protein ABQ297_22435, partial [Enterobacter hormaechei]
IRCVCGKKIGPDPRNFNQRVSLGRHDLLIRTFPSPELENQNRYNVFSSILKTSRSLTFDFASTKPYPEPGN